MSHVERQLVGQAIDEGGPVLVQEGHKSDGPLLRVTARKGERTQVDELPAQSFVAALGRLDCLPVQRLQIVLHPSERRSRGAFERSVQHRDGRDQLRHLRLDRF